jgi:hypothetical protein
MRAFREWLKWRVAGDELRRLARYRSACFTAHRWLSDQEGALVASWIEACGEDRPRCEINAFREALRQELRRK